MSGLEDRLRYILGIVNEHLKLAEAKNAVMTAAAGGLALGLLNVLSQDGLALAIALYTSMALIGAAVASIVAIVSFLPQIHLPWLRARSGPSESDSLLFFGHIQKYDPAGYLEALSRSTLDETGERTTFQAQVAEQIVINARIASRKFTMFKYAVWALTAGLLTPIAAYIVYEWMHEEHVRS